MRKQKTLRQHQGWTDRKLYPLAITAMVLSLLQFMFSLPLVGRAFQYDLCVTWLPLVIGVAILAVFRWKYLLLRLSGIQGFAWKLIFWAFMLLQGILFSYMSFGLTARAIADALNRMELQDGPTTNEQYPIKEAYMRGGRSHVDYIRDGNRERVKTGYVAEIAAERWDPPLDIVITTTPGILGSTILLDYSLVTVQRNEAPDITSKN